MEDKKMRKSSQEFDAHTHEIISAAMEVHNTLGPGFQEVVYQRALAHEMRLRDMDFDREVNIAIHYRELKVGKRRVDFMVGECLVEIKAKTELEEVDFVQTLSYLKASGKGVALLLNFGAKKLGIKRILNGS